MGEDRIVFGTDNPFFPPPGVVTGDISNQTWPSTTKIHETIASFDSGIQTKILRTNACRILNL